MKTAYVASTLPALFLKKNIQSLKIGIIVCASEALKNSYNFLKDEYSEIEIVYLSDNNKFEIFFKSIYNNGIIIFHECCWLNLDDLILKYKPNVHYYPCVTLNSYSKITKNELNIFSLFKSFFENFDRNIIHFIITYFKKRKNFTFYKIRLDGEENKFEYVTKLNYNNFDFINTYNDCFELRKKEQEDKVNNINSKNVIFIVATDVISDDIQITLFNSLKSICEKSGLNVFFKNHPNPKFKLNLPKDWKEIPSHIPFEVLEIEYLFKIGLFSTALIFEHKKSISISNLIHSNNEIEKRRSHNMSLLNNNDILQPMNLEEFKTIVSNFIK